MKKPASGAASADELTLETDPLPVAEIGGASSVADIAPSGAPASEVAEDLPSAGGSYIRLPDGTLQREEEA